MDGFAILFIVKYKQYKCVYIYQYQRNYRIYVSVNIN